MAKTSICRLGAGAGVRRCAGGGAAQRALFTQSPPTPSARGVGGAVSAVPQRQGVAPALWGSLAAVASWQPSASRLVREASAGPPECSPAPGFRPLHPGLLRSVGQRPTVSWAGREERTQHGSCSWCDARTDQQDSCAIAGPAAVHHQHADLRNSCRKRAPPDSCTGQVLRAGWERICRDCRAACSHLLLFGRCLSGVLRSLDRLPHAGGPST